jgi:DNA-binding transcriptional ArsR family regulator
MIASDGGHGVFAALADPTRRQLLATLAHASPKTATQLAQSLPMTRQGVLKHLEILASAGLVQSQPKGRENQFSFTPAPLQEVSAWIEQIGATWDERLHRLKALVEEENDG